jgi:nucleotide-binding universal stress UspA family protein
MKRLHAVLAYVNGKSTDEEVVALACSVAKRNKARVHVIYVIEVKRTLPLTVELQAEMDKGEEVLERAERVAEDSGYAIETEILQAREIGPAVVDEAVERGCDLVIVGVPYRAKLGDFEIGSAASHVLKNSPSRVLLMRGAMGE